MKSIRSILHILLGVTLICSCNEATELAHITPNVSLIKYKDIVKIDSLYTYPGDSLYQNWINQYNKNLEDKISRSLSPEDDAFFNKQYIVKSTEATVLYGRNYIFPGSILEGNSISNQNYIPVFISNRKPITVSMTLAHNTPKPTSRTIEAPTFSKLSDYVVEMVTDGNFEQNQKFMFSYKRFSFYDEIKTAFGTNINTRKLFSSKSESSTEYRDKIQKSTGMYVKFFQSSFTVNMDIAPLSDQPIQGKSEYEPVYVNSLTYGRLGIIAFETDESYEFAETCIKKEFDRIFSKKTTTLNKEEEKFFENTEFKVLIIGGDSNLAVQTFKGYSHFLNLIYNSKFTETSYGVPITCSFSYANSHGLVETEFINTIHIEPLYVKPSRENNSYLPDYSNKSDYHSSSQLYLYFYKDREKTKPSQPYIDIIFNISMFQNKCNYEPNYKNWPMINANCTDKTERIIMRNIDFKSKIYVGYNSSYYESTGSMPMEPNEPMRMWNATEYTREYSLLNSPFYQIIY